MAAQPKLGRHATGVLLGDETATLVDGCIKGDVLEHAPGDQPTARLTLRLDLKNLADVYLRLGEPAHALEHLQRGQAACVAPVAEHDLGAAAYAIKAVRAAAPRDEDRVGPLECQWQRERLPGAIRELVLDDQRKGIDICWSVFDC